MLQATRGGVSCKQGGGVSSQARGDGVLASKEMVCYCKQGECVYLQARRKWDIVSKEEVCNGKQKGSVSCKQ